MKEQIEKMTEQELKALITQATALLEKREQERKKAAVEKIRKLAAEAGVSVAVKDKGRPGRKPRKAGVKPEGS